MRWTAGSMLVSSIAPLSRDLLQALRLLVCLSFNRNQIDIVCLLNFYVFLHPSQHFHKSLGVSLLQGERKAIFFNPLFRAVMAMD